MYKCVINFIDIVFEVTSNSRPAAKLVCLAANVDYKIRLYYLPHEQCCLLKLTQKIYFSMLYLLLVSISELKLKSAEFTLHMGELI